VFWTRDGRLTDANDAFLRMVGYTRDELKSGAVDWRNMTPPEWNPLDEQAFAEMERTGICTPYEKEYLHKDGRRVPILLGVAFWEGSTTEGVAWIVDQTERNAAMERERDARAAAESAVRKRDEFLSIASHELKTPLTSLSLNLQSLERTVNEKAEGRIGERVDRMRAQLARLTVLVDQLLDVGRLERGLPPRVGEVDLVELARSVLDRFDDESRATDTPLVFHAPATLKGLWDRDRLDQVFTNLISNAVKYGRGAPVEVELASTENSALLSVRDHGIGIPRTEHARIFERFERASSARNYGGLGLGLWITREIVSAHGGTMEVESDTGRGATFRVVLPRTA
jgi:PAS domain S-box-containing protein